MLHPVFVMGTLSAVVAGRPTADCAKPPAFFLAGDSTTAIDGGWGDGLLATLGSSATGLNIGKSGATTASFRAGGYWSNVTQHVKDNVAKFDSYVTISFGHNDQKDTSGISLDQFKANLIAFANEVKDLGGIPLLTTSLTRRAFPSGQDHNATDSLHDQRLAAIEAAEQTGSTVIDLNAASLAYVNAIGKTAAYTYNYGDGTDTTHLNEHGTVVFGRMVSDLIIRAEPCLESYFVPNETLSNAIWNNQPA
ncbi:carbohydrate esterase family 12 protein [Hypoxylon sp. FL1150]|nr:carbohydrate esterase family 12 protein [Hypoxylon sp. FL1150]